MKTIATGIHWAVESSLCSGGVEGSLVLQQAGLEAIAWHDIVQAKKLMSVTKFQDLRAVKKIKKLASLYGIPIDIPPKCSELEKYANEHKKNDLVEVMVDVRNAIIHGTPSKIDRVIDRPDGETERIDLWFQIGGILEQVILAIAGYKGQIVCRNSDAEFRDGATRDVTWKDESK
jgi:hypothetical protein